MVTIAREGQTDEIEDSALLRREGGRELRREEMHPRRRVRSRLPDVFDPGRKPWIDPDRAESEQLLQVIMRCPTGALHLERSDGEQAEPTPERNTAIVERNGPVYFRGDLEIVTREGEVLLKDTRIALCRCGASENKPFCDGSHVRVGFAGD